MAGLQAEVLNVVLEDLMEHHAISEKRLKEVLGHTPRQVCFDPLELCKLSWMQAILCFARA